MDDVAWLSANTHTWSIEVNEHRTFYDSVATALAGRYFDADEDPAVLERCIAQDRLVVVQVYPDTPVGHYRLLGTDPVALLKQAREAVELERAERAIAPLAPRS